MTERELARAVSVGEVRRVRAGLYADPGLADPVRHAAEHGGVPACTDAGELYGLWILQRTPGHVWLGGGGNHHGDCLTCVLHWDEGTVRPGHPPPIEVALLQIARCAGDETFFAALESALRWVKIGAAALAWLWHRLPITQRELVTIARADADSGLESIVRLRLHRLGIEVTTQVYIRGVGEVDMQIGDLLLIECDGRENHERETARHKDLLRDAAAASRGYETLRFDYAMIVHDWPKVEAAILAKVRAGAHLRD